ncbi:MAG: MTAP family purine nucleoside phosphorylase [Methanomicrobiales archaeon]|nr:MTAP family purine nucleoside phosphorylase [Methanomicrobiales archaeon]
MLGIIGGTSLLFSDLPPLEKKTVHTPYGPADIMCGEIVLLMRHQKGIPPHRIDHRAHLSALALQGVDRVVAIGSVGSLRPEILPGSILVPSDYIAMGGIPTIHDHAMIHVCPEISPTFCRELARVVPEARSGGVYVQTTGPRIETIAEVRMYSRVGDVVGMTLASEATLAFEMGLQFAALCNVDNYAHGLGGEVLTYEHILAAARENRERTAEILLRLVKRL